MPASNPSFTRSARVASIDMSQPVKCDIAGHDAARFLDFRRDAPYDGVNLGLHPLAHLGRQRLPDPNELADGSQLHLAHDVAAVELDG